MRTTNLERHDPSPREWRRRAEDIEAPRPRSELPVRVRFRAQRDAEPLMDLASRVFPPARFGKGFLGSEEILRRHLAWFPEGQWVAERADGRLVGASMCLRVDLGEALAPHTRHQLMESCFHDGEQPWGNALYGVGLMVEPAYQGKGIGRFLVQVQVEMGRVLGCRAFLWGARMAGLHKQENLTAQAYLDRVRLGLTWDPSLGPMLAMGFQVLGLLERYTVDPDALGYGTLLHRTL
ncbi:MAG: GNAT family N-acetyltransferase [Acidobacteria bacterium]|nr:GNAT family N-acetyltransferase [Acidobacteriota bacterium]